MNPNDQYDLFGGHPPAQRHSDTSQRAALEIETSIGRLQALVLAAITHKGGTDEELMARTGLAPNTYRPRRRELQLKGLVRGRGIRGLTNAGRSAVIWVATEQNQQHPNVSRRTGNRETP